MNKIIIIIFFLCSLLKTDLIAQDCIGNACGVIQKTPYNQLVGNNVWCSGFTFKNNGNGKVKLGIKWATMGIGGGCGDMKYDILNPGEEKNYCGAYCPPYEANYTDNPVQTASSTPTSASSTPQYATPQIEDGFYRIRNAQTGAYICTVRDFPNGEDRYYIRGVYCDTSVTASLSTAKWKIAVKNRAVAGSNAEETYEITSKASPLAYLTAIERQDLNINPIDAIDYDRIPYQIYYADDTVAKRAVAFPVEGADFTEWEMVRVAGSDRFLIKGQGHYYFLTNTAGSRTILYQQIIGNPLNAQWYLERCE